MASTDWTLISDGGTSSINSDAGAPSPTAYIELAGRISYQNITGGTILDGSFNAWIKTTNGGNQINLTVRAQDSLFDTGDRYVAVVRHNGGAAWVVRLERWDSGTSTQLFLNSGILPLTGSVTDWQHWKFSAINNGGNVLLRMELWNGVAFVDVADVTDASTSKITTAGRMRFGQEDPVQQVRLDNAQLETLA